MEALLAALPELIAQPVIPRSSGTKIPSAPTPASTAVTVACASRLRWFDQWDEYGTEAERSYCGTTTSW